MLILQKEGNLMRWAKVLQCVPIMYLWLQASHQEVAWIPQRVSSNVAEMVTPGWAARRKNIQMESNKSARMHAADEYAEEREAAGGGQMPLTSQYLQSIASEAVWGRLDHSRPPSSTSSSSSSTHSEYLTRAFVSIHVCVPSQNQDPNASPKCSIKVRVLWSWSPSFQEFGLRISKP